MTNINLCTAEQPWTPASGRAKHEISHPDFDVYNAAKQMPGTFQFDDNFRARCKHCGFSWPVVGVGGAST